MKHIYEISKELLEQVKKTIDAFQKEAHSQQDVERKYFMKEQDANVKDRKISFYESQNILLRQRIKELEDENKRLRYVNEELKKDSYKSLSEIPLISELALRELNNLVPKLCNLAKREKGTRKHLLERLGLDDMYNTK